MHGIRAVAMLLSLHLSVYAAEAGCPCQGSTGGFASAPAPLISISGGEGCAPHCAAIGMTSAFAGITRHDVGPPPGTLGQTYQIPSRPVPVEKHPRAAMIDVHVPGATKVIVHGMNPFRSDEQLDGFQDPTNPTVWHFESQPLIPGQAHIYRVEAHVAGMTGISSEERYVRLIMGRLVQLTY